MFWLIALVTILQCIGDNSGQRVAPGVPPQNYQQQPQVHPGQGAYQQPHTQQQQVPVQPQFQQPTPQQQQQQAYQQQQQHQQQQHQQQQQQQFQQQPPQQQQQVPVQQQQHHQTRPAGNNPGILNAQNIAQEKDHIAEHMEVPMDTSKMSEQELQFHYFKMHDADNNNKLDGCELIKSLIHWHVEQGHKTHQDGPQPGASPDKIFADDELINLIDPILSMDDRNKDGYIDYPEFVQAQQKSQQQQQQRN